MKNFATAFIVVTVLLQTIACNTSTEIYDNTCEGLSQPLAIDTSAPCFSWKFKSANGSTQTAYRIQVASSAIKLLKPDIWDSGIVESSDQVLVPYSGPALNSRQLCWWRVKVWSANGGSSWSKPSRFGIGIIGEDKLNGSFIGAVSGEGRGSLLKQSVDIKKPHAGTYLLHVCSMGYHDAFINGKPVSDAVLTPAVSQLDKRALIVTYDVSKLIRRGRNDVVLRTSSGWYKPLTFGAEYEGALVKAELDLVGTDGSTCLLATDGSWQGAWSGYCDSGNWKPWKFGGEVIDARVAPLSMDAKSLQELDWGPVDVPTVREVEETPQMCELCRVQELMPAVTIEPYGDGGWIVDFGKVVNALCQVRLPKLPAGTEVTAQFCDSDPSDPGCLKLGTNVMISSGREEGDLFTGRFNSNVFRYVIFENLPVKPLEVNALRMRTDFSSKAYFSCSDPDLQAVYDMVAYTMENLAFDGYMVDCASIERLGYGGDGNASTLSLQMMADVMPLYRNWMQAWRDVIRPDGSLPHTAPCPVKAGGGPYWCSFIVQAPWRSYMSYGDVRTVEECYPAMKQWLGYVDAWSVDGLLQRWPNLDYRHWYLGDWLAPDGVDVTAQESVDLVNNCALSQCYADLVQIAELLGKEDDKSEFACRLSSLNTLIHKKFYHPETASYGTGSQLDMIYPMLVGAVPAECIDTVRATLMRLSDELYHNHISVGLVGVPVLAEWATLAHEADYMYGMLKQRDYPGYLFMIDNGATGTWESWSGRRSHLHNCYNGILSWFYQALGGIIPVEAGYKTVQIDPQMPEGLDWVKAGVETPYGPISVSWRRNGEEVSVDVDVPSGVTVL